MAKRLERFHLFGIMSLCLLSNCDLNDADPSNESGRNPGQPFRVNLSICGIPAPQDLGLKGNVKSMITGYVNLFDAEADQKKYYSSEYHFDKDGKLVESYSINNQTTSVSFSSFYVYDEVGNISKRIDKRSGADPCTTYYHFNFEKSKFRMSQFDSSMVDSIEAEFSYDSCMFDVHGRIIQKSESMGGDTYRYKYDIRGNMIELQEIYPKYINGNMKHVHEYDGKNNRIKTSHYDSADELFMATTYNYDFSGHLIKEISYNYDRPERDTSYVSYTSYVDDSHGNWTERNTLSIRVNNLVGYNHKEFRIIEYH